MNKTLNFSFTSLPSTLKLRRASLIVLSFVSMLGLCVVKGEKKENYIRKELISFTWGNGEYQIGSKKYKENHVEQVTVGCENVGPGVIKINNKGEIFIIDPINFRFLLYKHDGKYLSSAKMPAPYVSSKAAGFDINNNLYLKLYGSNRVIIVNPNFEVKAEMDFNLQKDFSPTKIYIKTDGKIIMASQYDGIYIIDPKTVPFTGKRILKLVELDNEKTKKIIHVISPVTLKKRIIEAISDKYISWLEYVDEDKDSNIYLLLHVSDKEHSMVSQIIIQKYNLKGELCESILLDKDENVFFTQEEHGYLLDVDKDGNIYHLWMREKGLKLVKWKKK